MEDLLTVFPFWSTREKSGAVSPTARLSWDTLVEVVLAGANADADAIRRERIADLYMVKIYR